MENEHTIEEIQELLKDLPYDLIDNVYDNIKSMKANYDSYIERSK